MCAQASLMEAFPQVTHPLLISRFVSIWQQLYAKQASKRCPEPSSCSTPQTFEFWGYSVDHYSYTSPKLLQVSW